MAYSSRKRFSQFWLDNFSNSRCYCMFSYYYHRYWNLFLSFLKVDIHYNLPTTRDEMCKFDVTTTVKETIKQNPGLVLFGAVQVKQRNAKGRGNPCKGKKKNKKKCKKGKKRQPPKPPPVKSIQLKVCARWVKLLNKPLGELSFSAITGLLKFHIHSIA